MIIRILFALLFMCAPAWAGNVVMLGGGAATIAGTTCTGIYGTNDATNSNHQGNFFTLVMRMDFGCTADAGATTLNVRVRDANTTSREAIFLIYADNNGEPGDLIWSSSAMHNESADGVFATMSATVTTALSGDYLWIGFFYESTDTYYEYKSETGKVYRSITQSAFPVDIDDPWDTANDDGSAGYTFNVWLSY